MALYFTVACFVVDQLLMAAGMARATYVNRRAVHPEDASPTLSMGITLDHLVAMFVPSLGAFIWNRFGYEYVFVGGACIALLNLLVTTRIELGKPSEG